MRLSAHFRERAAQLSLRPRRPPARRRTPISFSKLPFQLVKGQLWACKRAALASQKDCFDHAKGLLRAAERATTTNTALYDYFPNALQSGLNGSPDNSHGALRWQPPWQLYAHSTPWSYSEEPIGDKDLHVKSQRSICIKNIKKTNWQDQKHEFLL